MPSSTIEEQGSNPSSQTADKESDATDSAAEKIKAAVKSLDFRDTAVDWVKQNPRQAVLTVGLAAIVIGQYFGKSRRHVDD